MNLDDAVKSHTMWKMRLAAYLNHPDNSLNGSQLSSPNNCDLGKWLAGEGKKHANIPEFVTLVSSHARFHKAAGEVVKKANAGQNVAEEIALGAKSEFAAASGEVVKAMMAIKHKI